MQIGPFLAVAAIVVITPGVDMALVTRNALMHGRRAAVMTAFGINVGILFWVMAAALGLAAVVSTSASAFAAIKLAGAAYLVYLGIQALRSARRDRQEDQPIVRSAPSSRLAFRQGLVSNILNPKIAVFFTSLLPQFVGAHGSAGNLLLLGLLFNAMGIGWLICYATAVARGRNVLVRPRVKRTLDRISGLVVVGSEYASRSKTASNAKVGGSRGPSSSGSTTPAAASAPATPIAGADTPRSAVAVKWWFPGRYFGLHHKSRALEEWKRSHDAETLAEWKRRQQEG